MPHSPDHPASVAIIGAGLSGLACAHRLSASGISTRLFDKGRGFGGRMATRRAEFEASFDHGAQYFTVKDSRTEAYLKQWLEHGVVAPWRGRIGVLKDGRFSAASSDVTRYVAVPTMTALAKHLAHDLHVTRQTRITQITRIEDRWRICSEDNEFGEFDRVVVSAPAPQTAELIGEKANFAAQLAAAQLSPCWALMLALEEPLEAPFDGAFVENSPLSWIALNSSKPARPQSPQCWVAHAGAEWSEQHLEEEANDVCEALLASFWSALGIAALPHLTASAHRWRYSLPGSPLAERCLFDEEQGLGACGDWCGGPRVEGAFLSGLAMADALISTMR